jgi:hypothetical protein
MEVNKAYIIIKINLITAKNTRIIIDIIAIEDIIVNINTEIITIKATIIMETDSIKEAIIIIVVILISVIITYKY